MIIYHNQYIADTGEGAQTRAVNKNAKKVVGELAKCVAEYFVKHFHFNIRNPDFLFEGGSWMDPGPVLDLSAAFIDWDNTPLRPKPQQLDYQPSIHDIINKKWIPPSLRLVNQEVRSSRSSRSKKLPVEEYKD